MLFRSDVAVLNAINHAEEASIVSQAGQSGRITIATNMAGRGTDIRLHPQVVKNGGLHVIIAEINDSARIDRQLAGRCGRQGDPGSVSTYLCLEDRLAAQYIPGWRKTLLNRFHNSSSSWTPRLARWTFRRAQRGAEALAFQRRLSVLRHDDWMSSALPFDQKGA